MAKEQLMENLEGPAVPDGGRLFGRLPSAVSVRIGQLPSARTLGPVVALVVMVVTFSALNEQFLTTANGLNVLRQAMVLLVVALGQTFVILMGSIDISLAAIMSLVGMSGALLMRDHGEWAVLFALLIGLAAGALNGWLFAYLRLPSFLVTLGSLFFIGGIALYISGGRSVPVTPGSTVGSIFGGNVAGSFPTAAFWALAATVLAILVAARTKFGRYMYAIGGGEAVARLSGVPVRRHKFYAFVVAGGLAGLAGLLLLFRLQGGDARMGDSFLLPSIAAVVIGGTPLTGGMGGPARTVLGVLMIALLKNGMDLAAVDPFIEQIIFGAVVILAVALTMDRRQISLMK